MNREESLIRSVLRTFSSWPWFDFGIECYHGDTRDGYRDGLCSLWNFWDYCCYLFLLRFCVDLVTSMGPGRGGSSSSTHMEVWVATSSLEVMGVSKIFWTIFPLRACTNYPHGLRGGSLTLEDQLLVVSTDAMNGSVRVPPWH